MKSRIATAAAGGLAAIAVIAAVSAISLWPAAPAKDFGADALSVQSSDVVAPVTASLFAASISSESGSASKNLWPDRMVIPAIGLDMAVTALGLAADGSMALNERADTAAWYKYGAAPGERDGAALIAAHAASEADGVGPFSRLAKLQMGDSVMVTMSDGSEQPFTVVKREQVSKQAVDYDAITTESPGMLILVTCGGKWDSRNRHYDDNVIVWAVSTQVP